MSRINWWSAVVLVGLTLWVPGTVAAVTFDQAIQSMAHDLGSALKELNQDKVVTKFDGFLTLPGGNSVAFNEKMKEGLAAQGIRLQYGGNYAFVARLVKTEDASRSGFTVQLIGNLVDSSNRTVREISGQSIEDGRDLSESMGVTTDYHLASTSDGRQDAFGQSLENKKVWYDKSHTILRAGQRTQFGVEVRVNGEPRQFRADNGSAYVDLNRGEEYGIVLHNYADYEVAVDLKIDGLNRYYFDQDAYDIPSGRRVRNSRYHYLIIKPQSTHTSSGWYKTDGRVSRYKITPIADSAAAKADIPLDDVGMVSATFHASWQTGSPHPADEPGIARVFTEAYTVGKMVEGRWVYENCLRERIGTGWGTDLPRTTYGVQRTIGVPRATIVFRYGR